MDVPRIPASERDADATTAFARVTVVATHPPAAAAVGLRWVPRALPSTLLPGERITLGSAPHPVVIARPLLWLVAVAGAFGLAWNAVPVADRLGVDALGALAALAAVVTLLRNAAYYLGFRAVATNRRIFVIRGIVWRRFAPLGNTALASSTFVQGIFGRMYGFGSVDVPGTAKRSPFFRDMREAGALYRECQAVANGVDGESWTPAVRQTILP